MHDKRYILYRLRQEIARKRRGKLNREVLLLQDNAPAHTSQVAMTAATECGFEILLHPPYSPDMDPVDFYLFKNLNSHLRRTQYGVFLLLFFLLSHMVSWARSGT